MARSGTREFRAGFARLATLIWVVDTALIVSAAQVDELNAAAATELASGKNDTANQLARNAIDRSQSELQALLV